MNFWEFLDRNIEAVIVLATIVGVIVVFGLIAIRGC